jgi:hypothetical protein
MTLPAPLQSATAFRAAFVAGLTRMLGEGDGLGGYILVLANAAQAPALWQQLERRLEERHYHLAALITAALRQGRPLDLPDDDLLVFLKLMAMGFGSAGIVATRAAGPWEVTFNPLRALRPPRASHVRAEGISRAFDPNGFHFNLPILEQEVLWAGELLGRPARLFFNKFPFAELHGLLVPEPERGMPQLLTPEFHGWAWEVGEALGRSLPGFGLAYNSYGAHASVNHLHFQTFLRARPLPLSSPHWAHNGGDTPYPAHCLGFDDPLAAWAAIDRLHARSLPYNLLYLSGRIYLLARQPQGSYARPAWSTGHAWYEMAGGVVTFSREHFDRLEAEAIETELRRVTLT